MTDDQEFVTTVAKAIYEASPRVRPYERLSTFKRNAYEVEARAAIAVVTKRLAQGNAA